MELPLLNIDTGMSTVTGNCSDGEVRLVGGGNSTLGRVEVCLNDAWGTVCNTRFGTREAQVICRQLNFPTDGNLLINVIDAVIY